MTYGYVVFCHICGHGWDEQDPGVRFVHGDHVWECFDEALCFERRALAPLDPPPGPFPPIDTFHDPYVGHGPRRFEGIDAPDNWGQQKGGGR